MPARLLPLVLAVVALTISPLCSKPLPKDIAKHKKEIINSIGMKLVNIPPGKFTMGSPVTEKDRNKEDENEHEVEITQAFYMGKFEVTVGDFRKFAAATGYKTDAEKDGQGGAGYDDTTGKIEARKLKYTWKNTGWAQGDRHPVVNVSWNDARAFCVWLSGEEKREYDLPTEAQWEYACRGGTKSAFFSGEDPERLAKVGNVADAAFRAKLPAFNWGIQASDGHVFTAPVGQFRANAFGLHDMHGNAWEWCKDLYAKDYYSNSPRRDPPGPQDGTGRVLRGGSFGDNPSECRSASRCSFASPGDRSDSSGFRVVLAAIAR